MLHLGHPLGSGPPLVLLHGWALSAQFMDPLATQLAEHFRVYAVDLPGHGSQPSALWATPGAFMSVLLEEIGSAHVVGWSLGGMYALAAAQVRPDAVLGVGLIASNPRFVAEHDWPGVAPATLESFAQRLHADPAGTVRGFVELEVLHGLPAEQAQDWRQRALSTTTQVGLAQGLRLLAEHDARPALRSLAVPLVAIGGRRDRMVPPAAVHASAALAARGQALILDRAGHAPFVQQPQQVVEALRSGLW